MESNSNTGNSDSLSRRPLVKDFHNKVEDIPIKSLSKEIDESAPLPEDDYNKEGILDSASTPKFEEINNKESSGISLTQDAHSQRKIIKNKMHVHNAIYWKDLSPTSHDELCWFWNAG
ncbi:hypothetical protein O181_051773 [Austropuccinia psidii MF-1]|uniref:Uncharacterized protein n=1 Tax=Austropuccinia psidii MF-1 TaxID=1389203 RepID=A0A9Q3E1H0_9BASI|nr:hypothetical protein [Austropuccinia psidii MF-1]